MNAPNEITLGDLIQKSSYATFVDLERLLKVMTSSTPEMRSSYLHLHVATWKKRMILLLVIIKWLQYEKGIGSQFLIDASNMEEKIIARHCNMDRGIDSLFYVHASLYAKRVHAASLILAKDILASGTYPFLPQGIFQFGKRQDPSLIDKDLLLSEFQLAIRVRVMKEKVKLLSSSLINSIRILNGKLIIGKSHYYKMIITLESSHKNSKWRILDSAIILHFGKNTNTNMNGNHFKFYRNKFHTTLFSVLVKIAENGGSLFELCAICMYHAQCFLTRFLQIDSTNMLHVFRDEMVGCGSNSKSFNHSIKSSFMDMGGVLSEGKNVSSCEFLRWDIWHHPQGRFRYIVLLQQPRINTLAKLDDNSWVDAATKPIQTTLFALWRELDHVLVSKFLNQLSLGKVDYNSPFKVDTLELHEALDLYAVTKQMNGADAGLVQQYILEVSTKHRIEPIYDFLKSSQFISWLKDNKIHLNQANTSSGRCITISSPCETYKYTLEVCGITGVFKFDTHIASNLGISREVSEASSEILSELNNVHTEHLIAKSSHHEYDNSSYQQKTSHDTSNIGGIDKGALLSSTTCSHIIMLSASMVLTSMVDSIIGLMNISPSAEYPLHMLSEIDFEDKDEDVGMKNISKENKLGRAIVLKTWREISSYSPIHNDYNKYNPKCIQIEITTRIILYTTITFPKFASESGVFTITFWGIISTFEESKSHSSNVSNSLPFKLSSFEYTDLNDEDLSNIVFEMGVLLFDMGKQHHLKSTKESFTDKEHVMSESLKIPDLLKSAEIIELSHNISEKECIVFLTVSNSIQIYVSFKPNDNIKITSSQHDNSELSTILAQLYLAESIQKYLANRSNISNIDFTTITSPYLFNDNFVLSNQSKGFLGEILTLSLNSDDSDTSYFMRLCLMPKAIVSTNSFHSITNNVGLECTGIECGNLWHTDGPEQHIWGQVLIHRVVDMISGIYSTKPNNNNFDLSYAEELICWNLIIIAFSRSFIAPSNSSAIFITQNIINNTATTSSSSNNSSKSSSKGKTKSKAETTDADESSSLLYSNFNLNIQEVIHNMSMSVTWSKDCKLNDTNVHISLKTNENQKKKKKSEDIIISFHTFWKSAFKDILDLKFKK